MKCVSAPLPSVESRELSTSEKNSIRRATKTASPSGQHAERDEELRLQQHPAIRDREHEEAAAEPEETAARERRQVDDDEEQEEQGERHAQPVPALEPEVDRQQEEDSGRELDPEVVRIAREGVDAVDERALDRAEDVDPAVAARDRLQPGLVEVRPGRLGDRELEDAVGAVRREAADERRERQPVEPHPAPRDERHARDEEGEVEQELDHPLRPLGERLCRLEVEPPDQVDEEKRCEERERHRRRPREVPVEALDPVDRERDQEDERDDVRERHRPRDLPLELRERDREDRGEEEPLDERRARRGGATATVGARIEGDGAHARVMVRRRVRAGSAKAPDQAGWSSSSASKPAPRASARDSSPCS